MAETLITGADATATPPAPAAETPPAALAADAGQGQKAGEAEASGGQGQAADGQGAGNVVEAADGGKSEGDQPAGEEKTGSEATLGAPEQYADFTLPEGVQLEGDMLTELRTLAKELNLPQEAAQRLVDLGAKQAKGLSDQSQATLEAARTAWADEARADAEFGGDKLTGSLTTAKKALDTFGSPALKDLLDGSGLGNHPEFIRLFVKVGQAISEDRIITGNGSEKAAPKDPAKKLYPNMA